MLISSKIVFKDLPQNDPLQRQPDISLAKRILNWSPKFSLHDGMEKTYEWISSNFLKRENNSKFTRKID